MTFQPTDKPQRRQRIKLPFDNRKSDAGEWAFDHRAGLCITLIVYLVIAIAFVTSKIVVNSRPHMQGMVIDIETLEELAAEKARLEREIERKQQMADYGSISNRISNANSNLSEAEAQRAAAGSDLSDYGKEVQDRMRANRDAFNQGVNDANAISENRPQDTSGEATEGRDAKVAGNVTVEYSFTDPVRQSRKLPVPAYTCQSGGRVMVNVTLNRSGNVIAAEVDRSQSDNIAELHEAAVRKARESRFNLDQNAPERHRGTITYLFRPQ